MHREANAEAKDVGAKKRRRVFPEDQGRGKPPCKTRRHKASSIGPVDGQDTVHVPARALLKEFGQAKLQRLRTKHISCSVQHQNQDMQLITRRYIGHYMKRVGQAVSGKKAPLNFVRAAHLGRCKGEQTWASRGLLLQWLESFGASKKLPTQGGIPVLPSGALGDVELARAREDEVAIVVARLPDARKRLHFYITSPVNTQMLVVIGEEKRVGSGRFQYRLSRSVGQALGRASREMCERGLSSVRTVTNWLKSRINASKHSTCVCRLLEIACTLCGAVFLLGICVYIFVYVAKAIGESKDLYVHIFVSACSDDSSVAMIAFLVRRRRTLICVHFVWCYWAAFSSWIHSRIPQS
mmetsp:Transcript_38740/g.72685  ORF Transcript_38740/g.72685 Transcript_38740/m.72685 type:complete len:353 (+) Transcript_38740:152-1210(+)